MGLANSIKEKGQRHRGIRPSTRGGLSLRHLQPCIIEAFTVSSSTTTSAQRVISTPMEKEADLLVFFRKIADLLVYMNKMMDILY